jgi:dolichol kinase
LSVRRFLKLVALAIPFGFLSAPELVLAFVSYGLVVMVVFEIVRAFSPAVNRWYLRRKSFAKEKEAVRVTGYTLFFISAFIVLSYFPPDIAVFALTLFVVGDTMAPIGGKLGGSFLRREITHGKNGGGALAIFLFGSLAGMFLSSLAGLDLTFGFIVAGALTVVILDVFSFIIDDNLLIPIGSALVMRFLL